VTETIDPESTAESRRQHGKGLALLLSALLLLAFPSDCAQAQSSAGSGGTASAGSQSGSSIATSSGGQQGQSQTIDLQAAANAAQDPYTGSIIEAAFA
jgi:hypothetical protein